MHGNYLDTAARQPHVYLHVNGAHTYAYTRAGITLTPPNASHTSVYNFLRVRQC